MGLSIIITVDELLSDLLHRNDGGMRRVLFQELERFIMYLPTSDKSLVKGAVAHHIPVHHATTASIDSVHQQEFMICRTDELHARGFIYVFISEL